MATTSTKRRKDAGERLKGERERLGYAPRQIAQLLGVPLEAYDAFESGTADPGIWRMPRLAACGFDVLFIITGERHLVIEEENELLTRFRELSQRGRASVLTHLNGLRPISANSLTALKINEAANHSLVNSFYFLDLTAR